MYFEKPLYLVDTLSPLIYAWPSWIFFIGDTQTPLIYEPGSPIDLAIPLPPAGDERDDPYLIEKHKIGSRHIQLPLPALCITNPKYIGEIETLLYGAGLFPIIIDDAFFGLDSSYTLESIEKSEVAQDCQRALENAPVVGTS